MLIIIGKTASGKDTVVNRLVNKGYKKIVMYTSRPIRRGEKDGITYHYISDEEFKRKISEGFFLEYKTYDSSYGLWHYGCAFEDFETDIKNKIVILTPDGYRDFLNKIFITHKSIYLYANNNTIKKRLMRRGDKKEEARRRLENDNLDFHEIEKEVDRIVYNNDNASIELVIKTILDIIKEE